MLPIGALACTLYPGGPIPLRGAAMTTAFLEHQASRRWRFELNVNNGLDDLMVLGAQHAAAIDPGRPRTFSLMATSRL